MILEDYEALKCRYPSKKCWNQRAVKRNGERHNLCEMHRQKANNNQRRLDKKRKAGHMLKGEPGSSSDDTNAPELDYHTQAVLAHQHQQRLLQQQQQHMHHHHSHHHPYHRPALQHHQQPHQMLHPEQLSLLQRQQALSQHYQQQQEKRLRVSLTNMYAAAQALSPHRLSPLPSQQQHSPPTSHALAPLRSSSSASAPRPVLHLPPLTSHIPTMLGKSSSSSRSSSPQAPSTSTTTSPLATTMKPSLSPQLTAKPTILLPPITSVPRCHQTPFQLPLAGGGAATNAGWRSEEKAHLAK